MTAPPLVSVTETVEVLLEQLDMIRQVATLTAVEMACLIEENRSLRAENAALRMSASGDAAQARAGSTGAWLRAKRRAAGVTQTLVASRAGIDNTYLCHIESGLRHPKRNVLVELAGALRLTEDEATELMGVAGYGVAVSVAPSRAWEG